jgi:hypothetical protein
MTVAEPAGLCHCQVAAFSMMSNNSNTDRKDSNDNNNSRQIPLLDLGIPHSTQIGVLFKLFLRDMPESAA